MVSSSHAVCSKGLYIAMISTTVETDKPELEIRPAIDLLGDILEMFVQISTIYEPVDDGKKDNVIIISYFIICCIALCNKELRCDIPLRISK